MTSSQTPAVVFFSRAGDRIVCEVCPRFCKLKPDQLGICRGRKNIEGVLRAVNYGRAASAALDPIEKKPLYHFHPGSHILSAGPNSCNLNCKFCQNCEISQFTVPTQKVSASSLVDLAKSYNSVGIAYTYTEPLMWYEFILDCAAEFKANGMVNVLVTNGYINPKPLEKLLPLIDAMNIDLKSIENEFYRKLCGGVRLQPVLDTISAAYEYGVHIELTQLIIPTANDSDTQIEKTVDWIAALGKDIPLHFSRYFPRYKYKIPPTPVETLKKAYGIASHKLEWVYVGNIAMTEGSDSFCPQCKALLVQRRGYSVEIVNLQSGSCAVCGKTLYFH